jgi:AbrB family looped-hinge helix DNA binding protein
MSKTHPAKIREAIIDLVRAKPKEIMIWIKKHYPDDNLNTRSYRADIIGCSINHSSSKHYPNMPKFLWFNKQTKEYSLAKKPMSSSKINAKTINIENIEEDIEIIDGIPISKLSITGKITIPSPIRKKMHFKAGDTLGFVINENGSLEIKKARLRLELK